MNTLLAYSPIGLQPAETPALLFPDLTLFRLSLAHGCVGHQRQEGNLRLAREEPFEDGYKQGSPINFASQLQGELLLIHGTGDDNVHYQGSERLIDELVRHNRQFDFMSYPNRTHGVANGEGTELHRYTMMTDYFVEHLDQLDKL